MINREIREIVQMTELPIWDKFRKLSQWRQMILQEELMLMTELLKEDFLGRETSQLEMMLDIRSIREDREKITADRTLEIDTTMIDQRNDSQEISDLILIHS